MNPPLCMHYYYAKHLAIKYLGQWSQQDLYNNSLGLAHYDSQPFIIIILCMRLDIILL